MKKRLISAVVLLLSICVVFSSCSKSPENIDEKIDEVVAKTLISKTTKKSDFSECPSEGHIILGYEKKSNGYLVYTITRTGMYGFENGNFVIVSGTLSIPAIIELTNKLEFRKITYAQEGSMYESSVKELFPEEYHERLTVISFEDEANLNSQQTVYAQTYLDEIGREAKIGRIDDFKDQYQDMNDFAIRPSVYEKLFDIKEIEDYPYWQGTKEAIEDGVRVVYKTEFQMIEERIVYTKTVYDTNEILEIRYYDNKTAEEIK